MIGKRIIGFVLVAASALLFPWWVTVAFALIVLWKYPAWELFFVGLILDSFYPAPFAVFDWQLFFTFFFLALIVGAQYAKTQLIVYTRR